MGVSFSDREYPLRKGELNDGEFEEFLTDIAPALEQSVGRLGVAGHLSSRPDQLDAAKTITIWPEFADRVVEELR
ncbi:MAG TPA: hypothetical protein VES88_19005 [Gemmatimonadaceae bacterium]|nr:hypothetical protein [Gemmatimonadaceae bacterium]